MNGRYPFKSAWSFKRRITGSRLDILRTQTSNPQNGGKDMWLDWFFSDDGIITGFGVLKRWTGTSWVESPNIKVHYF